MILNIVLVVSCAFISYAIYSIGETGDLRGYNLIPMIMVAAITSISITLLCCRIFKYSIFRYLMSLLLSYTAYSLLLFGIAAISGNLSDMIMWFPIILWYGLFAMLPLTAGSIVGTAIFVKRMN